MRSARAVRACLLPQSASGSCFDTRCRQRATLFCDAAAMLRACLCATSPALCIVLIEYMPAPCRDTMPLRCRLLLIRRCQRTLLMLQVFRGCPLIAVATPMLADVFTFFFSWPCHAEFVFSPRVIARLSAMMLIAALTRRYDARAECASQRLDERMPRLLPLRRLRHAAAALR